MLLIWAGGAYKYFEIGIYRLSRLSDDGGAGRVSLISEAFAAYLDSPAIYKIMGSGYHAFSGISEKYVSTHNDLLDFLLSYGLAGLIFLTCVYIRLGYICYRFRKHNMLPFALVTAFTFFMYGASASSHFYFYFFSPLFISIAYLEFLYAKTFISRA